GAPQRGAPAQGRLAIERVIGPSAGPLRILHLEDSDLDAELIEAELDNLGHPVVIERVMTREEFAAAAVSGRHDIILADYVLPT
ncbi:response regulator, partial [Campylobacter coli]|uniref:response regulator n=1 Tax=Campylobacter coli TaxID=195 RepID=UPI001F09C389